MSEFSGESTATLKDVAEGQGQTTTVSAASTGTGTGDLELSQKQDESQGQESTQQTETQGQEQPPTTAASIGTGTDDLEEEAQGHGQEAWNLDSYLQSQGEDKNPFSGLSDEHLNQLEDVLSSDAVKSLLQQAEFQNLETSLITSMDGPSTSQNFPIDEATAHQIIQDGVREHELAVIAAAFNDHAYAMPLVRQPPQNITTNVESIDTPSPSYELIESPSSSFKPPATPTSSKGKRGEENSPHEPIRRSTRISDAEQREMAEKILQENRQKAREALLTQEDKEEEKEEPKKGKRGRKPKTENDSNNPLNTKWNKKNKRTRSAKNGEEEEVESGEEGGVTEEDTPKPAVVRVKKATEGTETPPPMKRVSRGKWKNPLFKDRPESDGTASPATNPASASVKGSNSPALTRNSLKKDESESDNKPTPKRGRGRKKKQEAEEKEENEEDADEQTASEEKTASEKTAAEDKNGDAGVESIPYSEFITQLDTKTKGKKGTAKKGLVTGKKGLQKAGTAQTKQGKVKVKDQKESGSQSSEEDIPLGQLQQRAKPKKVKPKLKATLTEQPAAAEDADEEDVPLKTLSQLSKSPSKLKKLKAAISSKRTVKMLHKKPVMAGKSKFLKTLKPPSQMKMMQEKKKKMAEKKRLALEQKLAEEEAKKEPVPETPKTPTGVDKNAAKRKARKSETEVFIDPTMTDLFKPDGMIVHEHEKEAPAPEVKFDAKGHRIPDSEVKTERKDSDSKQVKVEKPKDVKPTPIKNEKQEVSKPSSEKAEVKKADVKVEKSNQVKVEKSEVKKPDQMKTEKPEMKKSESFKGEKSEVKKSEVKRSDSGKGEKSEVKRSDLDKGEKSEVKKERRESGSGKHKISSEGHHEKHRHSSDEKRKHSTEERDRHSTDDKKKLERRSVGETSEKTEKERKDSKAINPEEAPGRKLSEEGMESESDGGLSYEDDENDEDWLDPNIVYCLCRKPHSNRFMIECDCCEKWYHGSCVGVTEAMGKEFESLDMNFVCPVCTEAGKEPKAKPIPVQTFHSPVKVFSSDSKVSSTTVSGDTPKTKHRHHSKPDAETSSSKSSDKSSSSKHHHRHHHHKDSKHRDKNRDHSRDKDRKDHRHRSHSKDHKRSKHHKEEDKKSSEKKDEGPDPVRLNVRKHLRDALSSRAEHADDVLLSSSEIKAISLSIEEEMFSYFKDVGHKYRNKYRSLIFNIKDTKNNGLFRKILNGKIRASKLVQMSSTELASKELAEWRKMETKHTLKLIEETEKKAATESFHIRKKTHKGEIELDEDMSNLRDEAEKPTPNKPKIEPKADLLSELIVDTTDKHRLHLFDLNCKICTGKQAPPSEDSTSKKVTIAHAVEKEKDEEATKETTVDIKKAEQVVKEALANVKKAKVELPDSPVTVRSPDSALQSGLEESRAKFKPSGPVMWKGFIHMQEFNKFFTSAYRVSGPTDGMSFADTIQICGRIIPEQIWDYLSKIKQAGTRDVCVIRFIPAGDDEKTSYVNLYSYLNSRARCGVVGNAPKQVKDFYIIPLASHSRIPQTLLPFDGPGLEENRPHMLIGVLVRQKSKPPKSPLIKETSKSKQTSSSHSSASSSKKPRLSVDSPSSSQKEKKTSMYVPKVVTPGSNSSSEPGTPGGYKEIQDPIIKAYAMEEVVAIETEESSANDTEAYSPGRVEEEEVPYDPEFEENNSVNTSSGPSSAMARAMELTLATFGEPPVSSKASSDAPKVTISLKSSASQSKPTSSQPSTSKKEVKSCLKNPSSSKSSEDAIFLPQDTPSSAAIPSTSAASTSHHHHHQHQHHSKPGINIEKLVQQIANSTNRSEITALMVTALAASKDATDQQKVLADLTRKVEEQKKLLAKKKAEIETVRASTIALTATAASMSTASQPAVTIVTESPEKQKTSPVQKTTPKVDYVVAVKHSKHDAKDTSSKKDDSVPKEKLKDPRSTIHSTEPLSAVTPVTTKELDSIQISKALDALKTTKMLDNLVSVFKSTQSKTPVTSSSATPLPFDLETEAKAESISVSAMKPHEMPLALQALMKDVMGHGSESGIKSKKIQKEKEKKAEEPKSDLEEDKDSLAIFKGVNKREKNVIPGLDDLPIASVLVDEKVIESAAVSDGESSQPDEANFDKDYRSEKKTNVIDITLDKDERQPHSLDKDDRKAHSLDKDDRIIRGMLPRFIPTQPKKDWTAPSTTAEQITTWPVTTDVDHRKFPKAATVNVSTPQPPLAAQPVAKEGKFRPVGVPKAEEVKEDIDHRKLDGPMRPIGGSADPFGFGTHDVDMRRPPTGQAPLLPPPMPPVSNAGPRPLLSTPVFQGNQPPFRPPYPAGDQRFRAPGPEKRGPPFQPTLSEGEPSDKRPRFPGTSPGFRQPLMRPPAPPGTEPITLMPPGMPPLPSEPLLPPPLPPPPLPSETVQDKDLRGAGGDSSRFGNGNRQSSPQLEDRDRYHHHHRRQHDRYHNRDKDYRSRNRNRRR